LAGETAVRVFPCGVTSSEASSPGTDRPFGETPSGKIRAGKEAFARSARTRRSARRGPRTGNVQGGQYVIGGDWHLIDYRDDPVKHTASPSRLDCSRRVVILRMFQIQSATPEAENRSDAIPLRSARLSQPVLRLRPAHCSIGRCVSLLLEASEATNASP